MNQESSPPTERLPPEVIYLGMKAHELATTKQGLDFPGIAEIKKIYLHTDLTYQEKIPLMAELYQKGVEEQKQKIKEQVNNTTTEATPTPRTHKDLWRRFGAFTAMVLVAAGASFTKHITAPDNASDFCNTTKAEQASIINHVKLGGAKAGHKDVEDAYEATAGRAVFNAAYNRTLENQGRQQASDMVVQALQNQWNNCGGR